MQSVRLEELLASQPPPLKLPGARARLREHLARTRATVVTLDDDPTGTQTVHGITVLTQWPREVLHTLLAGAPNAFFLSTNSRALSPSQAATINRQIGGLLRDAAAQTGRRLLVASRSDSTLRGHFPCETDALAEGLGEDFDAQIIAPAFFDGGRYTIGNVHWVEQQGMARPAGETEFAHDPNFGFVNSELTRWVEEKTGGRFRAADVLCISLNDIRVGGPERVTEMMMGVRNRLPVVVNAAADEDLEVFALALAAAEDRGRRFLCRCAASLVKIRAGIEDHPLLTPDELRVNGRPGLVVVGSYVEKTSRQLTRLLAVPGVRGVEIGTHDLLDSRRRDGEIRRVTTLVNQALSEGSSPVVYTSRGRIGHEGGKFLEAGATIMTGLCRVVREVTVRPGFVLTKGGITSHEVACAGLRIVRAEVLGQIHKGVPVWRTGPETRWPDIPYVIFPGNVGNDDTLAQVVRTISANSNQDEDNHHDPRQEMRIHCSHQPGVAG